MILSIESSCDDSSLAITEIATKKLIYHKKISQELDHSAYGGVVPELASRLNILLLTKLLEEIKPYFGSLKAVAVTNEPGLAVTLLEGLMMAKAIAIELNIPIIGVNHLVGHIYSLFIESDSALPSSILLVSGGHTMILEAKSYRDIKIIAQSGDDSFGESFDKVSKMMGLGYPGGPVIEKMALLGNENALALTLPLQGKMANTLGFSYSGLKNQVRLTIEEKKHSHEDIAASFQRVAVGHLIDKTKRYFKASKPKRFAIVGGASANLFLREKFGMLCADFGVELRFAPLEYCSDNAAMIGRVAVERYLEGDFDDASTLQISPKTTIFN